MNRVEDNQRHEAFARQARSPQMRRFVASLDGFAVDFELPDEIMSLLQELDTVTIWPTAPKD